MLYKSYVMLVNFDSLFFINLFINGVTGGFYLFLLNEGGIKSSSLLLNSSSI